jgi:thiol-disulfide isomerase/thioredoxin
MQLPARSDILAALRDPKRWRRWAFEALIVLAVVVGITLWQNRGLAEGSAPPLTGLRTDGTHIDLRDGKKTTLVVFWATWCGVCKAEAGNIESVAADWPVITVAMQSGDLGEVARYLSEKGLWTPALGDDDGDIAQAWKVRSVPAHFIVDGVGNIRFRVVGYTTAWGLRARLWWAENFPA